MKAIILAAGKGLRMKPLTNLVPKPMIEISGKPLLHHLIDSLPNKIDEIAIVTGYLGAQIKNYFGSRFQGYEIHYFDQQDQAGTAHALHLAKDFAGGEKFLSLHADDLHSKPDLENLITYPLSVLVKETSHPREFGVVVFDKENKITQFIEKPDNPPSSYVSTGAMVLNPSFFEYPLEINPKGEYFIPDVVAQMIKNHDIIAVPASFWFPVSRPEDIKKAEAVLKEREASSSNL